MALMITSRGILSRVAQIGRSGVGRSAVVSATAFSAGLATGKLGDSKKVPLIALGAGAGLHFLGASAIGDGSMAAGSTILGYRFGARAQAQASQEVRSLPAPTARKR